MARIKLLVENELKEFDVVVTVGTFYDLEKSDFDIMGMINGGGNPSITMITHFFQSVLSGKGVTLDMIKSQPISILTEASQVFVEAMNEGFDTGDNGSTGGNGESEAGN